MSTNTQNETLKSPKISDNADKQSNHRLMNVLCRTKDLFADVSNLQSNKRQKKGTLRFSHPHLPYRHLFKREISHSKSCSHILASLINHHVERAIKCRFTCSSDRLDPELRFLKINLITVN